MCRVARLLCSKSWRESPLRCHGFVPDHVRLKTAHHLAQPVEHLGALQSIPPATAAAVSSIQPSADTYRRETREQVSCDARPGCSRTPNASTIACGADDRVQPPFVGKTFETVSAVVFQFQRRVGD